MSEIITESNLKTFFYSQLDDLNKKSLCPVPQETIFYSSDILDKFALAEKFFEIRDGRISQKILGQKLLATSNLSIGEQKREYKDIGDTALFICGYFRNSLKNKILDTSYYSKLGITAYNKLNGVEESHFQIPSFYNVLATCFENITVLMSSLAMSNQEDPYSHLLVEGENSFSDHELAIMGISKAPIKAS